MPDLGWDIAETQLVQENQGNNDSHMTPPTNTNYGNHHANNHSGTHNNLH